MSEQRVIKFRIVHKGKIVGYEHLTETGWKWNWIELNPDKGERWSKGVIEDSTPTAMIRQQFTGLMDKHGKEIWEGSHIFIKHGECIGHSSDGEEEWIEIRGTVSFEDSMFVFDGHSAGTLPLYAYMGEIEVIETPELLKP